MKCAVIIHIFYYEIADEFAEAIKNICDVEKDIFLTVSESIHDKKDEIAKKFPDARISVVKNVGYDIWPFLCIINQLDLNQYDLIVKLHTKRDMPEATFLKKVCMPYDAWRKNLLMCVKTKDVFRKSLAYLEKKKIGMVSGINVLMNKHHDGARELYPFIKKLMNAYSLPYESKFQFVAGTMFVGKAPLFGYLKNRFKEKDFIEPDSEHKRQELPHILERILGYAIGAQGYEIVNCKGKDVEFEARIEGLKRFFYRKQYTSRHKITRILGFPVFIKKNNK